MTVLTEAKIKSFKPGPKQFEVGDGKARGLALRVMPSGVKTWSFRYRTGNRWRRVSLGPYPQVKLADAREMAGEHLRNVRKGGDPSKEKREAREQVVSTFWDLAGLYLDRHAIGMEAGPRDAEGWVEDIWNRSNVEGEPNKRSWKQDRAMLRSTIPKSWRPMELSEITRKDVIKLVDDAAARRGPIQANRIRALLSKMFNFAMDRELVELNPVTGTPVAAKYTPRDRVLSESEIRQFWTATETMDPPMRARLRLVLLTAQRPVGEVGNMRWSDIEGDVWMMPTTKNKRGHRVPLTPMALEIVEGLDRVDDYVMAGARGNRQFYAAAGSIGLDDFKPHDLRRTATSLMAEAKVPRLHVDKVLNHADQSVTGRIYDKYGYDPEKRTALEALERKLRVILEGGEGGKVVSITRGAAS